MANEWIQCASHSAMRAEVIAGLKGSPKRLPPKYLYDAPGARLFNAICNTPEYYVARTERQLLASIAPELARLAGTGWVLIEPGSGSSEKAQLLFDLLKPAAYVPVEICMDALDRASEEIAWRHPWLTLAPRCADFNEAMADAIPEGRRMIFFPGSTIGNFEPRDAICFLERMRILAGPRGALVVGVDLNKDAAVLNAAYNDEAGITARFNLNLLARLNRELRAQFQLDTFEHRAFFAADRSRVEMHLQSRVSQSVPLDGEMVTFAAGETIHTENSYKYTIEQFRTLASRAGWYPMTTWADPNHFFSVHYFVNP